MPRAFTGYTATSASFKARIARATSFANDVPVPGSFPADPDDDDNDEDEFDGLLLLDAPLLTAPISLPCPFLRPEPWEPSLALELLSGIVSTLLCRPN